MSIDVVVTTSEDIEEEEIPFESARLDLLLTNGAMDGARATGLSFPLLFFLR